VQEIASSSLGNKPSASIIGNSSFKKDKFLGTHSFS